MRLIDADALINTLQELFDKREKEARFTGDRGVTVTWNDAIYHIKTAPTIEERKTGRWIHAGTWTDPYTADEEPVCQCSVCGQEVIGYGTSNFCSKCGADMRGET